MKSNRDKRKTQQTGINVIIREQIQLVKAEKEIKDAILKCQQYKNKLMVEELELKARLARNKPKPEPKAEPVDRFANYDKPEVINQRLVDLRIANPDEEFDSD